MNTIIERFSPAILQKAQDIKLLALDVDGILSDGKLYYSNSGDEIKAFCTQDGLGIKLLQKNNIEVAIITGRTSQIVERRAGELGITSIVQGRDDKLVALKDLKKQYELEWHQIAYMGDDLPDLSAIQQAGFGASVPNGHLLVQDKADWVTSIEGGSGAVREIADLILQAQHKLDDAFNAYML